MTIGSRKARAARSMREELPVERPVRLHCHFRLQGPAFDGDVIERIHRERGRYTRLDHFRELQLATRPRFLRGDGPGASLVRTVVKSKRLAPRARRAGSGLICGAGKVQALNNSLREVQATIQA
ncbi:hypothetical protein [Massilia sp. TWP1-3-3]|uniref:hypothetical protein n=1 Tax=Massilia sp. TWP1-3-3 TaxID=2804573 RepID=UPI003CEC30E9